MGGNTNAYTSHGFTTYYHTVPAQDINLALHIGALRMAGVNDSEVEWKVERGAIEQEVAQDHSRPGYALREKMLEQVFAGTPYAHTPLGTKTSFDKTTAAMLKAFYDKWYAPNNALLAVTGDVNPQEALAKVKELYGQIPEKKMPEKPAITFAPVTATTLTTKTDQPYGYVELAFRMPGYRSSDYPAAVIATDALASQRGPIAALAYEGKALNSGFSMEAWKDTGLGYVWAVFSPGVDPTTVKRSLLGAVHKVLKDGINPELIAAAKRRVELDQQLQRNSIHGLANSWSWAVARAGFDSPAEWFKRLQAVTPADVNEGVGKILDLSHAVTLIAKPTPGAKPVREKPHSNVESFTSKPSGTVTLPDWATKAFAKLPHPEPFLHPADMMLSNGIRLIVQPLKVSHSVTLIGAVHQNAYLQSPKGQMGVSGLLNVLFSWGPRGMTRLQFEAVQDRLGIDLSVGSDFSLYALPQQFAAGVKLLADTLLHPSLPASALSSRRAVVVKYYKGRIKSPRFKFGRAIKKALLPKGDPALRLATGKSASSLTVEKVRAYYDKVFRPDQTTIVVLGDITPVKARTIVEKYLGAWQSHGPKPDLFLQPIPLSSAAHIFVSDASRVQNSVYLAETLNLTSRDPAHFALDLANALLSQQEAVNPLFGELRSRHGLVYGASTSVSFSRHRGSFYLWYGSYPDKYKQAKNIALKVLERVRNKPFSASQLHLAKSIALRQIELGQQSIQGIGGTWLGRSQDDLPLDWSYVMARHFEKLTAAEVQQAMKKYLDPSRLSTFVLGPPNK